MRYLVTFSLVLAGLWLGLSGVYKPVIIALGGVSVALVAWLSYRMDVLGAEHDPMMFSWRLPVYWGWLLWQIVIANVQVAACACRPGCVRPQVLEVPVPQRTPIAQVTYANSVTLTPGTVTLVLDDGRMRVHALTQAGADGLRSGEMSRWVSWLEGSLQQESKR